MEYLLKDYGAAWCVLWTGVSEQIASFAGITAAPSNDRLHEVNTKYWIRTQIAVRQACKCADYKQAHGCQEWGNVHNKFSPIAIKRTQYIMAAAMFLLRFTKERKICRKRKFIIITIITTTTTTTTTSNMLL